MNEGEVILAALPVAGGGLKNRPAIVLREMPSYGDLLVCGLSTQIHQEVKGFDEVLAPDEDDYASSGVVATSLIRLGFLGLVARRDVIGVIGAISSERHARLVKNLCDYLTAGS
jgi:mRNA interferase MazF